MKTRARIGLWLCATALLATASPAQPVVVSSVADLEAALAGAAAGTVTEIRITQGTYNITAALNLDAPASNTVTLRSAGDGPVVLSSTLGIILETGRNALGQPPFPRFVVSGLTFSGAETAINANHGDLVVSECTFVNNDIGFYMDSTEIAVNFVNDTFTQNGARCAGNSFCGAIWLDCHKSFTATNVTVANNPGGVGIHGLNQCGVDPDTLENSIVTGHVAVPGSSIGGDCHEGLPDVTTTSIDSDGSCGGGALPPALLGLGPLADNGGFTRTMALSASSPAVNLGSNGVCPAADQRGVPRSDGACDVGAFELAAPTIPSLSITDVSVTEGISGVTNATFNVTLSAASSQQVIVNYATANGTAVSGAGADYQAATDTLIFAPNVTSRTITVLVNGDTVHEANETFFVNLSSPTNANIAKPQGVGTILNDEAAPSLSINDASITEGDSGTIAMTFVLTLSAQSDQTVSMVFATVPGTAVGTVGGDFHPISGTLTFPPLTFSQDVTVLINGETRNEADETFSVQLFNVGVATVARGQAMGTIVNDDPLPSLSIDDVIITESNSGVVTALLNATLSAESGQPVMANFGTADGTATSLGNDYFARSGFAIFSPGVNLQAGDTRISIFVQIVGDTFNEPNETFFVNLTNPVNATIARGQGVITIVNDDGNTPTGGNVSVRPTDPVTGSSPVSLTFSFVTQAGDTTLTTSSTGPPTPAGFQLGNPPVYFDLSTTAVFSGSITICINYSGINFTGPPQLFHFENGMWRDVTSSVDTVNRIVCGVVTSLSPFGLFEPGNRAPLAKCRNVTTSAGPSCKASATAADVNDGSSDPDGDPITFSLNPAAPFALGATSVVLTVTDDEGASSQCNATITVVDDTAPAITCPPDVAVSNTPGLCSANVEINLAATALDNCSTPTVSGARSDAQPLAAAYPVGTTEFISTATDGAGNQSACVQRITVNDTEAPTLNVPSPITTEFTDENGAAITYVVASADNCSDVTVTCTPASGSTFPIGTSAVTCTALDLVGNSTTGTFTVTVLGARGVKQDVLADLQALRTTVIDPHDGKTLDRAISDLQESLDPAKWIDQTHVRDGSVFKDEKNSVNQLTNLISRHGSDATLQGFVDRIVKADRLLCTVAINDAAAAGATDTNAYAQAISLRASGDEMIRNGQYESAIEQYRNSWSKAVGSH